MENTVTETWSLVVGLITTYGLSVVGAIVILVVGFMAAGWMRSAVRKALSRIERVDATLRGIWQALYLPVAPSRPAAFVPEGA